MHPKINPEVKSWLFTATAAVAVSCAAAPSAVAQSSQQGLGFADYSICRTDTIEIPAMLRESPPAGKQGQITAESDVMYSLGDDRIHLDGNVRIVRDRQGILADRAVYDKETDLLEAKGNVKLYTSDGDELKAETVALDVIDFSGVMQDARIRFVDFHPTLTSRRHTRFEEDYSLFAPFTNKVPAGRQAKGSVPDLDAASHVRARATAASIEFEGGDYQLMHDVVMTNCEEGNRSVELSAKRVELDHVEGTGIGRSMIVKFKKVPIFYLPVMSFPIDDRRKTGFLFPGYGYDEKSGLTLELPYYIHIAPQYDATVTPRIYKNRGIQLYGEYRYLAENFKGDIRAEFLPSDDVFDDQDRYASSIDHEARFGENWDLDLDFQDVSDNRYLYDFSSDVDVTGTTWILQKADLRYYGDAIDFKVETSAYKRVNDNVSVRGQPYERLPEARLDLKEMSLGPFRFGIDSQYTNYAHDDITRVDGSRLRVEPRLSLPMKRVYGHLTPEVSLHSIRYDLENNPAGDDSPSVVVPVFSMDSGLIFERFTNWRDTVYMQTLEPRLFYVNIPTKLEQEHFPDFDTGSGSVSSFSHFFRENRFFGGDRVGDTHQVSLGLTSRTVEDDTGKERVKINLGQVYYLDDREVGLFPGSAAQTGSRSDFLAESTANLNEDWSVRGFARWSADQSELEYISVSADYDHSRRRNASVSYSRTKDVREDLNLDFDLPVSGRWQLDSDVRYTLRKNEWRSVALGVAYDGCCWAARMEVQRYPDGRGNLENRFMFIFELDDLGRISTSEW